MHDCLGQNLGYLHLRLNQIGRSATISKSKKAQMELERLREVANESYEIVRDILQKLQPETIPHLTNLLKEHAVWVSRTENFTLDFDCKGCQVALPADTQGTIFNAFHEVL